MFTGGEGSRAPQKSLNNVEYVLSQLFVLGLLFGGNPAWAQMGSAPNASTGPSAPVAAPSVGNATVPPPEIVFTTPDGCGACSGNSTPGSVFSENLNLGFVSFGNGAQMNASQSISATVTASYTGTSRCAPQPSGEPPIEIFAGEVKPQFTCSLNVTGQSTITATGTLGYSYALFNVGGSATASLGVTKTFTTQKNATFGPTSFQGSGGIGSSCRVMQDLALAKCIKDVDERARAYGADIKSSLAADRSKYEVRTIVPPATSTLMPGAGGYVVPVPPKSPNIYPAPYPGMPGGTPCFPIGALVSTPSGSKKIESIVKGDVVWGWNSDSTGFVPAKVASIGSYENLRVRHLVITDGTKRFNFDVTFNHNLLIKREGKFESVPAGSLKVGDIVHVRADEKEELRSLQVAEIAANPTVERVFNIEIENARGYFVNGVLVESMSNQETVAVRHNSDRLK
jgi:hypothetical protein